MTAQGSPAKIKELRLPISRVKTIMKSSPYVDTIGQDGLYLVTKATVRLILNIKVKWRLNIICTFVITKFISYIN